MASLLTNEQKRAKRIRHLIEELDSISTIDTEQSLRRCRVVALELAELFRVEGSEVAARRLRGTAETLPLLHDERIDRFAKGN